MTNIPIGEVLKEKGYITGEQLNAALEIHRRSGKRVGDVLVEMGLVTERQILSAMAQKMNLQILSLETCPVDIEAVRRIPRTLADKYCAIAVSQANQRLTVVIDDPLKFYGIEDIRQLTGMTVDTALAERREIEHAIDVYYSEIEARRAASAVAADPLPDVAQAIREIEEGDETPVIKLLSSLLLHGYNVGASDIHIEPMETETRIRLRIDGMLLPYLETDRGLHPALVARIKILSNLDIAEKRSPQDGHFKTRVDGVEMNLRTSVVPSMFGEKVVLRYLNSSAPVVNARQFGMNEKNYQKFQRMLQNPNGIIYLTGPTGSGKTTTLYFALEELVRRPVNISTIEDPVERHIRGVTQMQVNPLAGLTFDSGLRALLRQDPDIIMVGETRDSETASISVRSAITGHLVLSTLHTNDALSTIVRLEDMGVEPFLVANSVVGLMAQRLVRRICPHCKEAYQPAEQERVLFGTPPERLYRGKGCPACSQTGYRGRIAVHEVVAVDREMRRMITSRRPIEDLYAYAREQQGFTNLVEEACGLALEGVTTAEELTKLTYYVD